MLSSVLDEMREKKFFINSSVPAATANSNIQGEIVALACSRRLKYSGGLIIQ